jgi:hypothetical protein
VSNREVNAPTAILLVAASLLCYLSFWLFLSNVAIQPFLFSSDQLTIPSFIDDLLRNRHFSIFAWSFPRAPLAAPDGLTYFLLRLVTRDTFVSIYALVALQIVSLTYFLKLLLSRIAKTEIEALFIVCQFLLITCFILLLPTNGFFWMMTFWHFVPLSHAGSMIAALAMFVYFERAFSQKSVFMLAGGVALCFVFIFSDRLFLTYFSAPYFVTLVVMAFVRGDGRPPLIFCILQIFAIAASHCVFSIFNTQPDDPIRFDFFNQLSSIYQGLNMAGRGAWLFLAAGFIALAAVGANAIRRLCKGVNIEASDRHAAELFLVLMCCCNVCVTFLLWTQPGPLLGRYGVGYQFCFVVFFALVSHNILERFNLPMAKLTFVATVTLFAFGFLKIGFTKFGAPFEQRQHLRAEFVECTSRLGLKSGLANYWLARQITVALDWRTQIDQTEPSAPSPFFWGNSLEWFYLTVETGAPVERNFIIINDLDLSNVERIYGKPDRESVCGSYRLWLYDDGRRFQARLADFLAKTGIAGRALQYLPSTFIVLPAQTLRGSDPEIGDGERDAGG